MGKLIKLSNAIRNSVQRYRQLDNGGEKKIGQILMFTGVRYQRDDVKDKTSSKRSSLKAKKRHG